MRLPVLGRLSILEWPLLLVSLLLSWLEYVSNIITQLLPTPIIDAITYTLQLGYRWTTNPVQLEHSAGSEEGYFKYTRDASEMDPARQKLVTDLLNAPDIQRMCQVFGYEVESRIVRTSDDYLLTLHRLHKPGIPRNGRVVYLHHGLLMCSEIWVTMVEKERNLPYVLYELGYDVWLGNNRGNKYSSKHLYRGANTEAFWDFSIDEFALFDIPDSINYILRETGIPSLVYIGFSQGTAQAFASMSVNPDLSQKVEKIIAISPATTPKGLHSKFLDIFLKSSPNMLYLLFSRKVLMPSVMFWQKILYPPFFDLSIDVSNYMLFNWRLLNIDKVQKICSYAHLYSPTSVKTVVHWFQIILSKKFQMYHNNSALSLLVPIAYPLKNICVPIHLIYGSIDSLVDIHVMENQLPEEYTTSSMVAAHEHLDNLWGRDVSTEVFPLVLSALELSTAIPSPESK